MWYDTSTYGFFFIDYWKYVQGDLPVQAGLGLGTVYVESVYSL